MTCEFVKSAREQAKLEGLDPKKIVCDQRQINCSPDGCSAMQARIEEYAAGAKYRIVIRPKGPDPKCPMDSFLTRQAKTRQMQAAAFLRREGQNAFQIP